MCIITRLNNSNDFLIEESKVLEGIERSISNITDILKISEKIVEEDSDNSVALGLFSFAIEEFGKALLLKECLSGKKICKVPRDLFKGKKSHDIKFKKALDNLPIEVKYAIPGITIKSNTSLESKKITLTSRGDSVTLPPGLTGKFSMIGTFPTNFDMRMSCFYLDWEDTKKTWKYKPYILSDSISRGVWKFKKEIYKFEKSLSNDYKRMKIL